MFTKKNIVAIIIAIIKNIKNPIPVAIKAPSNKKVTIAAIIIDIKTEFISN